MMTQPTEPAPTQRMTITGNVEVPVLIKPLLVKSWWQSKTLLTNMALLVVFALGLIVQAAGIYHLSPELVAGMGIAAAIINFGLRLVTNSAVAGTPAAVASLAGPLPPH